jgi:recombination protein RecA
MAKNIDSVLNQINKKYGYEVIRKGLTIIKSWFPTGILNVDWALGGGFIQGGFVELYGPPSSGKSTLALKAIAQAQKQGKVCAYIDVEDAYDSDWAITNGVDNDSLLLMDKDQIIQLVKKKGSKGINAEFILQLMIDLIETKGIDILVLDSIACLVPKDELDVKEMDEEAKMAGVAKLMSRALRVMNSKNHRHSTIIFINQIRDNVGSYGGGSTTPGGKAVKFYAFQRVNVKRGKNVTEKDLVIGYNAQINVDKSKVSVPYRTAEYVMFNNSTTDRFEIYWNLAKNLNDFGEGIELKGRTYTYNGEVVAKSQDDFKEWLTKSEEVFVKLELSLINKVKNEGSKEILIDVLEKTDEEIALEIKEEEK